MIREEDFLQGKKIYMIRVEDINDKGKKSIREEDIKDKGRRYK